MTADPFWIAIAALPVLLWAAGHLRGIVRTGAIPAYRLSKAEHPAVFRFMCVTQALVISAGAATCFLTFWLPG